MLNLGADIRVKDRFGLSPMAYAIMLNSVDTAKILLEKGVKFEEVEYVAYFILNSNDYGWMSSLIIDGNDITINYAIDPDHPGRYPDTDINNPACVETCDGDKVEPFKYVVSKNLPQMAELMLSTGYKPKEFEMGIGLQGIKEEEKNATLVPLRAALDRKDTDFVVKFIKDNNLSVDVAMKDKRTPLMKLL